jgi:hypothetical protein
MNVIQQQLDMSRSLLAALDKLVDSYEKSSNNSSDQAKSIATIITAMSKYSKQYQQTSATSQSMSEGLNKAASSKEVSKRIAKSSNQLTADVKAAAKKSEKDVLKVEKSFAESNKSTAAAKNDILKTEGLLRSADDLEKSLKTTSTDVLKVKKTAKSSRVTIKFLTLIVDLLTKAKDALSTAGASLILDGLKLMWTLVKLPLNIVTSVIGGMTKFFTFTMTLPFTIAKAAAKIGNTIRSELVETIQAAGEEAKESFDLTSNIGENADKMTQTAKGLRKQFESPRTRLSKLFGMGASGAAAFLTETFKAVDSMGHYAEIFGPSILGSTKNGQFVIEMQRAMAIGAEDMAYYAIEAYNSGVHPIDVLSRTSETIKRVADENDLDFKAISKEYHKLRTNITEFGHLSGNEIGNLVGKLRKMKVKTEDAVNVFKKFTSFEEAAKSSAMLFQTFEMNVDAFDLLTARDPGEMLQQFRDAMFQTGKSFKDLNRHEKSLMSSITGVSEHGLSTLMNYMDLGLTQDEARKRMEEQDPTKEQTKMIKGLTSTIKLIQKTMQFDSPFKAFFTGLSENTMNQKDLRTALTGLSEIYDDIYHMGLSLDLSNVKNMLTPITKILKNLSETLTGDRFKEVLKITTKTASDFLRNVSYDLETDPNKLKTIKKLSIKDRIDELYTGLTNMTKGGSPLLKNFVTIAGELMGSIVKGAILGITAAFHLIAGGASTAASELGLTMTDKMKEDAAKRGIAIENYTILDWLGIGKVDANAISDSLGEEIGIFVKSLPSMASMAGSLLADMSEMFIELAGTFLSLASEASLEYYKDSNPFTKSGMRLMGFDIEAAKKHKNAVGAGKSLSSSVILSKVLKDSTDKDGDLKEGAVGGYISYIEDLQNSFPKTSHASKFLNNPKTKTLIKYLSNASNFKTFDSWFNWVADADEEQRSQAIMDIASEAFKINEKLPAETSSMFADPKKSKPSWYEHYDNLASKQVKESLSGLVAADHWAIAPLRGLKGSRSANTRYTDSMGDIKKYFDQINNSKNNASTMNQNFSNMNKADKPSSQVNAQDIQIREYTGRGMMLVTPGTNFHLDDDDSVVAAKKGGFLNNLFITLTDYFNDITESNTSTFNAKLKASSETIVTAKTTMAKLSNNIIKRNELNYDASEEDLLKLFGIYDDVINIIANKKINAKPAKVVFNE